MKFQENFRIVSRNDDLDAARIRKRRRYPLRMKQHVPYFPIISLREFQKFKLNYFENVVMKFRENFVTPVMCHYLHTTDSSHNISTILKHLRRRVEFSEFLSL